MVRPKVDAPHKNHWISIEINLLAIVRYRADPATTPLLSVESASSLGFAYRR
jgi:hypothetical protein